MDLISLRQINNMVHFLYLKEKGQKTADKRDIR